MQRLLKPADITEVESRVLALLTHPASVLANKVSTKRDMTIHRPYTGNARNQVNRHKSLGLFSNPTTSFDH